MKLKVAAAGGGTGGHLYPNLAILEEMARHVDLEVLYFVVKGKIDEKVISSEHPEYGMISLNLKGFSRPLWNPCNLRTILKVLLEKSKIKRAMEAFKPDLVILSGGYICGPVALAARSLKVPIFVHEQNVIPGFTNSLVSRFAKKVFVSFERSLEFFPKHVRSKLVYTGCPVRIHGRKQEIEFENFVLVLGGSLGSDFINSLMEKVYTLYDEDLFIHVTGSEVWKDRLKRFQHVIPFVYINGIHNFWQKAMVAITRGGASTLGEMMYYGVRGLVIPWEGSTSSHQLMNALEAEKKGFVSILREEEATPDRVIEVLKDLKKKGKLMRAPENPAEKIVKEILGEIR